MAIIEEKKYRRGKCPHCGTPIETRSYVTSDGDEVYGALAGRKHVHTSRHMLDGSIVCVEVPK
jgi:hypothetical protein